jgi:S1-C subfamily serine protease
MRTPLLRALSNPRARLARGAISVTLSVGVRSAAVRKPLLHRLPLAATAAALSAALAFAAGRSTTSSAAHAQPPPASATLAPPDEPQPLDGATAVERALAVTVTIEGDGIYGAGILIDPAAGRVLTAEHVVADMRAPRVTFRDGTQVPARVLQVDHAVDMALLSVPPQRRPAPRIADATQLKPGEQLYAVGCPRRLGFTVSRGIVSFVGRPMDGARWLQTDLPINDGNSGGPVVDARGEVVAMMSFVLRRAQGLSFALPINYAADRFPEVARLVEGAASYLARFRAWIH